MGSPQITYAPRPDVSPETEVSALANVYRFILNASKVKAAGSNGNNDANPERQDAVEGRARRMRP